MRKALIIIIILLIVLIFGQIIYYNFNKTENISSLNEFREEEISDEDNRLYVKGMSVLYEDYNPKISFEDLENKFYIFINETVPNIYDEVKKKSIEEIEKYYEQNKEQLKEMYIYSKEDFVMIAHQINSAAEENNIIGLYNYSVDTESISKLENGLIFFKVNFEYDNERQIQISYKISEENDSIKIESATGLDEMLKRYTGKVSKLDVLKKIDTFISSIKEYRINSTLKTENERRQYFDLNKENLEKIGITSQDDYVNVAIQVNRMRWRESDLQFEKYEILSDKIVNEGDYLSSELIIYYNYDSSLDLKISISNVENAIKISSYITDFN